MSRIADNRWTRAIAPALLIHVSIGTVYCWSVFKQLIADRMHVPAGTIEWGFSLAIFFLGMSAAFLGPMVEKDIKKSALVSMICFVVGFAGTGLSIALNFLPGVFICYGAIMGVGLGIGYLVPVKNLMLWFSNNKGLATGIAVAGFGLAKAIASPVMEYLIASVGLVAMFYILAAVYAVMMFAGFLLIKRPQGYVYHPEAQVSRRSIMKKPVFWGIWLAFYINITCGLALISQEKDILHDVLSQMPKYASLSVDKLSLAIAGIIGTVLAVDAVFNTLGRIGFSTLSDHLKRRETVYLIIFAVSIAVCLLQIGTHSIDRALLWAVLAMLFLVNAGYGGGFSTLPVLLDQHFGITAVSTTHGLALSAWAIAGLSGNQLASFVVSHASDQTHRYSALIPILALLYAVAAVSIWLVSRVKKREPVAAA
ncbi:OFA family MFS transporter [Bifidobacterium subtile]|jgi:OFA family oxalate/formate antiporter-like MFS transporter|uniref:Major facilitator superfamily protein n=1 Tax=Bifidobacterium subtile TaxID=77635 RepID=A0A087EA06_9BIFI|nr:OFA family MFS transporter [Bifidobacterium subtile]KFJ04607.1 major facilitator superfamily protein [Bifidobacterium subtile]QOL35709.1 OFA family MFS transporter [Bifidobacterium subtile]